YKYLAKREGDTLEVALVVSREGRDIEQIPPTGSLGLRIPGDPHPIEVIERRQLKVLFATPELVPFAKSGSVAAVTAALAKELHRLGHEVRLVMPRYRQIDIGKYGLQPLVTDLPVPLGAQTLAATIFEGRLGEMVVYFVDCPPLYDRDGIYGFGDDDARSVFFCRAL